MRYLVGATDHDITQIKILSFVFALRLETFFYIYIQLNQSRPHGIGYL